MAPAIYLVDHSSYRPPESFRVQLSDVKRAWQRGKDDSPFISDAHSLEEKELAVKTADDIIDFQYRVFIKAGLREDATFLPPSIHPAICGNAPKTDLLSAYDECKMAVVGAVEGLLAKTGLQPSDVDVLVTTCSIYCPTPSMASMVVNHFKMNEDIQSYHLGGMGCANGVVAINMVSDLLKAHPNANALFITNETTTPAFYRGQDKSRLVTNVLFRMGASAMLLSNKQSWAGRAKYRLRKALRVHTGAMDDAYRCIWYGPDAGGLNGVALGMNVVTEATVAMTQALTQIAPTIMTWSQILAYLINLALRRGAVLLGSQPPPKYIPCFRGGVSHFLLHAGGAKVLDGMGKSLRLWERDLEPSRAVLSDYGNISSSTTWYSLGYIETVCGVQKDDTILQVGVGSGVKCGVAVWQALRDIDDLHDAWQHRASPERCAAVSVATAKYSWRGEMIRRTLSFLILLLLAVLAYTYMTAGVMQQQQEVLTSKMQEVMDSMRQWVSGSGNGTSRQEL